MNITSNTPHIERDRERGGQKMEIEGGEGKGGERWVTHITYNRVFHICWKALEKTASA